MKKLVKTAKQQFDERLNELKVIDKETTGGNFTYYLCEDDSSRCIILERGEDTFPIYSEITMPGTLLDVYTDEDFLASLVNYWIEDIQEPLKRLFDWYASVDKENPPFGIQTMAQLSRNASSETFSDLYEEFPDVRIITAKEQWELDAMKSTIHESEGDIPFKVAIDDTSLRFYYYELGFYCDIYPPLESLRKDDIFIKDVTDRLLEFADYEGVGKLQHWIRFGGEFPLSFGWIFYSEYPRTDVVEYEDKELPQEQSIEEMIALTPEQQEKVKEFEVALKSLKESGVKIISYWDENEFYAVNGNCNVEFNCSYYLTEEEYNETEDISNLLEKNHVFPFSWDLHWGCDTAFCAKRL